MQLGFVLVGLGAPLQPDVLQNPDSKGAKVNVHSGFRSFKAWMGREKRKGIHVKPDKTCWDLLFGGWGKEQEGRGISQSRFQSVNFNLWYFIGTVKIVTHHLKVSDMN